jgi:hypothetical protein
MSKKVKIKLYTIVILTLDLYTCEMLSLILREEHRQRVFEKGLLKRIFGPKKDKKNKTVKRIE